MIRERYLAARVISHRGVQKPTIALAWGLVPKRERPAWEPSYIVRLPGADGPQGNSLGALFSWAGALDQVERYYADLERRHAAMAAIISLGAPRA